MKLKLPFHWSWIIVGLGLWVAANQTLSVIRLYRSGDKMKEAKAQLGQLQGQKSELEKKLASVDNSEYIERELRDKLGYGRPGETILVLPRPEAGSSSTSEVTPIPEANWKKWWGLYIKL